MALNPFKSEANNTMNHNELRDTAQKLLKTHGLTDRGWTFEFDNGKRRFGACHYRKRKITMSWHIVALNGEAECIDTLLHEIAHALTPHDGGHGRVWQRKAREIGCTATRCYNSEKVRTPRGNYEAQCSICERTYTRHRRTRRALWCANDFCKQIHNYHPEYQLRWAPVEETLDDLIGDI